VRAHDKAGRVLALPNQTPGMIEQYGLTRAQVDWEMWAVAPDGRRWAGAAGINRTLQHLDGLWPFVGAAYAIPPLRWIENQVYRWVAGHRPLLSRFLGAAPEWPGEECCENN
jgi:predicted DCC family thiol-disulfide oxidoreductase YuxK